jgi:hypothetical protein
MILLVLCGDFHAQALTRPLTRADMERALALARWPASDRERARFHERYSVPVSDVRIEDVTLEQIDFARLE